MVKALDYSILSPSLPENTTIHRTSSHFSLGIMEELTEVYIQSLEWQCVQETSREQ